MLTGSAYGPSSSCSPRLLACSLCVLERCALYLHFLSSPPIRFPFTSSHRFLFTRRLSRQLAGAYLSSCGSMSGPLEVNMHNALVCSILPLLAGFKCVQEPIAAAPAPAVIAAATPPVGINVQLSFSFASHSMERLTDTWQPNDDQGWPPWQQPSNKSMADSGHN